MRSLLNLFLLIIVVGLIDADYYKSNRRNRESTESYMLRKGGVSDVTKRINGHLIIGHVYITPEMRSKVNLTTTRDLMQHTICENQFRDYVNNTSRLYRYSICPDSISQNENFTSVNEYCCSGVLVRCCNAYEFVRRIEIKQDSVFNYRSILSLVGACIFVAALSLVIKFMCSSRFRHRVRTLTIFTRQSQHRNQPEYQQGLTLIQPPGTQSEKDMQFANPPNQQYAAYPTSQYPSGPVYPPGSAYPAQQYPYGVSAAPYQQPGQNSSNVPLLSSQAPIGTQAQPLPGQDAQQAVSQPPPAYENAIRQ